MLFWLAWFGLLVDCGLYGVVFGVIGLVRIGCGVGLLACVWV